MIGAVIVTDLLGKILLEQTANSNFITLNLNSSFSEGTYFLNIYNQDASPIGIKKLVLKH